jgi:hypothetical protein
MSDCVAESHLRELGESAVAEYDRRIASIPPELCAPFNITAMRFEDELLRIYKSVVFCVRDEQDLQKVASWWAFMVKHVRLVRRAFIGPKNGASNLRGGLLLRQHPRFEE